jgi:uncharacterized protein
MNIPSRLFYKITLDKSKIHGTGCFAQEKIPARKKLGSLGGKVVSKKQAKEIAVGKESISLVELWNGKVIDASREKGVRYINHSCAPNTFMRTLNYHVEFYTLRKIRKGEELTCNYGPTHHEGSLACRCGAPDCKGNL